VWEVLTKRRGEDREVLGDERGTGGEGFAEGYLIGGGGWREGESAATLTSFFEIDGIEDVLRGRHWGAPSLEAVIEAIPARRGPAHSIAPGPHGGPMATDLVIQDVHLLIWWQRSSPSGRAKRMKPLHGVGWEFPVPE